jgi:AN1-type zinc finger protein 2
MIFFLDFLPLKCDSCDGSFCGTHFKYDDHHCPHAYLKNVQVPLCPLCNQPVPSKRGEAPDIGVSDHIDRDCQSDKAMQKRNAVYTNKCSLKGCKQKELVSLICSDCHLNYCLKHRHSADHKCVPVSVKSKTGEAAMMRMQKNMNKMSVNHVENKHQHQRSPATNSRSDIKSIQGNLSEDEALARALQQSMIETGKRGDNEPRAQASGKPSAMRRQEQEDEMLAQAIAASQREANKSKDKCEIS